MSMSIAALYGGGPFYSDPSALKDVATSGFTDLISWSIHVTNKGDLVLNDTPIVTDGAYVGDAEWPRRLAAVKKGTVERVIVSVGAGGTRDFTHIEALIKAHGTGSDSPLFQSFHALLDAAPAIDLVDMDNEDNYDVDSMVAFCRMLHGMGVGVTFCPYTAQSYWMSCLKALNTQTPGLVQRLHLQCYSGGAFNTPEPWIQAVKNALGSNVDAASFIVPGLWCTHGKRCSQGDAPDAFTSTLKGWSASGIPGGFLWLYDDIQSCDLNTKAYAEAILNA